MLGRRYHYDQGGRYRGYSSRWPPRLGCLTVPCLILALIWPLAFLGFGPLGWSVQVLWLLIEAAIWAHHPQRRPTAA
ncbi:MAG: hypothetical protein M3Y33_00565 [Actinomycetota bacterium]|nr:hypothetical protein [Actinomycetota bacterium]